MIINKKVGVITCDTHFSINCSQKLMTESNAHIGYDYQPYTVNTSRLEPPLFLNSHK